MGLLLHTVELFDITAPGQRSLMMKCMLVWWGRRGWGTKDDRSSKEQYVVDHEYRANPATKAMTRIMFPLLIITTNYDRLLALQKIQKAVG